MRKPYYGSGTLLIAGSVLLAGCGGPPAENPLLEETRAAYAELADDPEVVANAPVALEEAEEALQEAETLWSEKEDEEVVEHHVYLARQRVHIAEEDAELTAAQNAIEAAEAEQRELLLQARAAEAEQARREAEQARQEAQQALARAEELAQQLQELQARQTERGLILTLGDVLFDPGRAELKPGGERAVQELVQFLQDYPARNVLIEGFTDSIGDEQFNLQLSQRRAEAVQQALVSRGIESGRVRTEGYGEDYPVADNDTAAGRQQNRRVEVIISDEDGNIPEREN